MSDGENVLSMSMNNYWEPARDVEMIRGYPAFFGVVNELSYVEITFESVRELGKGVK